MGKFKIRFTVENPNCLFYDVEIEAESAAHALDKADDIDLNGARWKSSDGNYIDTGEVQTEVLGD